MVKFVSRNKMLHNFFKFKPCADPEIFSRGGGVRQLFEFAGWGGEYEEYFG